MKLVNLKNNHDFFFSFFWSIIISELGVELSSFYLFWPFVFLFLLNGFFVFYFSLFFGVGMESLDKFGRKPQKEKISRFCP